CASAGTARVDEKSEGLVFVSVGDDLEQTTTFAGDVMVGASCVSTTLCYAAGNGAHGGFVVPINSGVVGAPYNAPAVKLSGLACQPQVPATAPASCLAVGSERQGPSTYGTLVSLMGSRVTPPSIVRASGGFTSVAAQPASPGFAALGPAARGPGCEVTLVG
ncbi:MAG TPA: hypothetical protein VEJ84_06030, partial [Acidimicrobiales bacterium]|nr:hypothetical protein [Acidimicrobiales bacterium]